MANRAAQPDVRESTLLWSRTPERRAHTTLASAIRPPRAMLEDRRMRTAPDRLSHSPMVARRRDEEES